MGGRNRWAWLRFHRGGKLVSFVALGYPRGTREAATSQREVPFALAKRVFSLPTLLFFDVCVCVFSPLS